MSGLSPIQRYLGLTASKDPFSMLGIDPDACSEKEVLDALASRLASIVKHPHANSIEVEEVRLALHAAAAQLLDPVVREHLRSVSTAPLTAQPIPDRAPQISRRQEPDEAVLEFQDAALRLIHLSGGWNQHAVHRVSALAHAYGLEYEQVREAFHRPCNGATAAQARRAASDFKDSEPNRIDGLSKRKSQRQSPATTVILVATAIGIVIVGAIAAFVPRGGEEQVEEARGPRVDEARSGAADAESLPESSRSGAQESGQVVARPTVGRENLIAVLRDSVSMAEQNPGDSAWRIEEAMQWLGEHWTTVSPEARDMAHSHFVEFFSIAAPGGGASVRVMDALTEGLAEQSATLVDDDISRLAWSAGATARIANASGAPGQVRAVLLERLTDALPRTVGSRSFDEGTHAALPFVSDQITGSGAAPYRSREYESLWRIWIACSATLEDGLSETRVLDAAEKLLVRGPSPASEPAGRTALAMLMDHVAWPVDGASEDESAPARRMLGWFDDERISTDALAAATEWLATNRPDSGVSFAMVLPRSAGPESRRSYRERFARAWSIGVEPASDSIESRWVAEVRAIESQAGQADDARLALDLVLRMSRLSEAVSHMSLGRRNDAARSIDTLGAGVTVETDGDGVAGVRTGNTPDDGRWALTFLSAPQNANGRLAALNLLDLNGDALGVVDAEVLAEVALWGSPTEVRRRASWLLLERLDQPTVLHGVLEALPRAPRNNSTTDLLESLTARVLPDPDADDWAVECRRAVVDTLLEMVAGKGLLGVLDAYQTALSQSYDQREALVREAVAERTNQPALSSGLEFEPDARQVRPDPLASARAVARAWESVATTGGMSSAVADQILDVARRRHARLQIAGSGLQRFVAEQIAIVEMIALVVQRERPESSGDVATVLALWREEQRVSNTVFAQMVSSEHAMLRLRFLRSGRPLDRLIGSSSASAIQEVGGAS